jgi:acyl carrier protein
LNDTQSRLIQCFQNVFPALSDDQIRNASPVTVAAWDSVAHITLLSAIGEEFGVEFEPDEYADLTSWNQIFEALQEKTAA